MLQSQLAKITIFFAKIVIVIGITTSVLIGLPIFQKQVEVSIDGVEQTFSLTGLYASELVENLDNEIGSGNYILDQLVTQDQFIIDLAKLNIKTKKEIILKTNSAETKIITFVNTLGDLIETQNLTYELLDEALSTTVITTGMILEEKMKEEPFVVEIRENADLEEGKEQIVQEGVVQLTREVYQYDAIQQQSQIISSLVVTPGVSQIIEKGTKKVTVNATAPTVATDSVWDKLALCESGGNWNANTGNGYYGGVQFSAATWRTASRAVGLNIEYAHQATREEQIMAATWLQNKSGWGQWPSCSTKLGLS